MAIHELATNALKYGALSVPQGRVRVEWALRVAAGEKRFRLEWTELDGPALSGAPTNEGFGATVIRQMAAYAVNGEASVDYAPCGLCWRLEAPAGEVLRVGHA